jgi:hypothetical protein
MFRAEVLSRLGPSARPNKLSPQENESWTVSRSLDLT